LAALAAEQVVERHARHLGLDIPQGDVDRGNGAQGDRPPAPIGSSVKKLPDILDPARILADQRGDDMVLQIGNHGQLAAVQSGVSDTVDTLVGHDLQGHEIAPWAGHNDFGVLNLHALALDADHLVCQAKLNWSDRFDAYDNPP